MFTMVHPLAATAMRSLTGQKSQIEFLINEWSTGERKKATFHSRTYLETFDTHYMCTEQWCSLEPMVMTNIQKQMFKILM